MIRVKRNGSTIGIAPHIYLSMNQPTAEILKALTVEMQPISVAEKSPK
jgi:hypothetical protein